MTAALRRLAKRLPSIAWRDERIARLEHDLQRERTQGAQREAELRQAEHELARSRAEAKQLRSKVGGLRKLKEEKVQRLREKDKALEEIERRHTQELNTERRRVEELTFRSLITAGAALQEAAVSPEKRWGIARLQTDGYKLRNYSLAESHGIAIPRIYQVSNDPAQLNFLTLDENKVVLKADGGHSSHAVFLLEKTRQGWQTFDARHSISAERVSDELAEVLRKFRGPYFLEEFLHPPAGPESHSVAPDDVKVYAAYGEILQILLMRPDRSGTTARRTFSRRYLDGNGRDLGEVADFVRHDPSIPIPDGLDEILDHARTLSLASGLSFVRVDMLSTSRGPVFGELTPRPGGKQRYRDDHDEFLVESWLSAEHRLAEDIKRGRPYGAVYGPCPYHWWYPEVRPEDGPEHPSQWPRETRTGPV